MNMIVAQIQPIETPRYGDSASRTQEIEPTQVRVHHQILIIACLHYIPAKAHILLQVMLQPLQRLKTLHQQSTLCREFVEIPFASANTRTTQETAVVTDVSNALYPNHKHNIRSLVFCHTSTEFHHYDSWAVFNSGI